jgi:N-acetylmuramoyl-L-alanine amidase
MTIPGRLTVGKDGKLTGDAEIHYNDPFPCVNGKYPPTGKIRGVVMHTMLGNLPGTVASFNDPHRQASAFFGVAQGGLIWQFGPVGKGWEAWAQVAGNLEWYSIEHADNGHTTTPLTSQQVTASAQLVECLSAFAGFPLQVTDSVTGHGYGTHVMGGAAWGGHTCPGPGPRAGQRDDIIALAKKIRAGDPPPPGAMTPGRRAFIAYGTELGWVDHGRQMEFWGHLTDRYRRAWENAAKANTP